MFVLDSCCKKGQILAKKPIFFSYKEIMFKETEEHTETSQLSRGENQMEESDSK